MIRAINDIVIIERDGYNGILIAPKEKMCHGTVISVGPGAWSANIHDAQKSGKIVERWHSTQLKPGQRVCFSIDKGEEHVIEGKHVVVMRESHIAGVLDDQIELTPIEGQARVIDQYTGEDVSHCFEKLYQSNSI